MHGELAGGLRDLESIKHDGRALISGLSRAQFNWRPAPDRWSIADCLVHLNDTVTTTLPAFDRAIARGREQGRTGPGPFRYGWLAKWAVRSMEPPPKFRMTSPRVFRTKHAEHDLASVLPEFLLVRDRLGERLRQADGLDLARVKISSPASRLFRLPLGAYFAFVLAHERRHLWQARQVRGSPGFPP